MTTPYLKEEDVSATRKEENGTTKQRHSEEGKKTGVYKQLCWLRGSYLEMSELN